MRGSLASRISIKEEQLRRVREERERIIRDNARVFEMYKLNLVFNKMVTRQAK